MQPARSPIKHRGPTRNPATNGVSTANTPGAIISLTDDLVEIITHVSVSGITSSSPDGGFPAVASRIASINVLPFEFLISLNWRRTSSIISAAAFPTEIIVRAPKRNGSIAPTRIPARMMGSLTSKFIMSPLTVPVFIHASYCFFVTSSLKAARSESAVSTADPTAKPLPIAAVVLPSASNASVLARTSGPSPAISAMPPALSATGP
mmetsp:Transcript_9402/g.15177  ORF Transcript_9402/g.15177 Transcript_9402/m.15177 type:complete len:207 (+) Transcript_9402:656-1276(+)